MKFVFILIFSLFFIPTFAYAQTNIENQNIETFVETQNIENQNVGTEQGDFLDILVQEGIAIMSGIVGVGITAIVAWMRKRGIPVTTEQENMFKKIVTTRFERLAKQSWQDIRKNPDKINEYWNDHLSHGKIPPEFVKRLHDEGKDFALSLKENKEFRDFAKNLGNKAMDRLLKDIRAKLKEEYQKRMIDVLPKLASIAVDSAFEKESQNIDSWVKRSLENIKPLLLSSEAIDNEENLTLIIRSEINKRLQNRLVKS